MTQIWHGSWNSGRYDFSSFHSVRLQTLANATSLVVFLLVNLHCIFSNTKPMLSAPHVTSSISFLYVTHFRHFC